MPQRPRTIAVLFETQSRFHPITVPRTSQSAPNRLHYGLTVLLAVVLVLAQTLGWMHRTWHAGAPHLQRAGMSATDAAPGTKASWIAALFDHAAGDAECRLHDAAGQPGCPPAVQVSLPAPVPGYLVASTHADFVARWAALFDARGPPHFR